MSPRPALVGLALLLALGNGTAAAREVAVLQNGNLIEVEGLEREGGVVRLLLPGGGSLAIPEDHLSGTIRRHAEDPPPAPATVRVLEAPEAPMAVAAPIPVPAPAPPPWHDRIDEVAARHGVDPRLVRAVIAVESAGDPEAVSPRGAMGLMQLMPATALRYGVKNPFDPMDNLDAGTQELAALLRRFDGEVAMALAAYNAGGGAVGRYDGIPPYRETLGYVRQVLELLYTAEPPSTSPGPDTRVGRSSP